MLRWLRMASYIYLLLLPLITHAESKADLYNEVKGEIVATDMASREFMSKLYKINSRMKSISKKRDNLTNKMINSEANVKGLAKTTAELEDIIKVQRSSLSKRIRTLYMLGEDKFLRAIFSANNSEDLQQTLKYLKLFSEQDYHMIRSYESNLKILTQKRERLKKNVAKLIRLKKKLEKEEKQLISDQKSKSKFLKHLSKSKRESLRQLSKLRKGLGTDVLNLSFFEKKGKLPRPFNGWLAQGFGMTEHPKYGYRLSHKGHLYKSKKSKPVLAVADGKVVYIGQVDGYGKTAVVDHGDHYFSVYSGLNDIKVAKGEHVAQRSALSENVNEIYFEIRHFSDAIDPIKWIRR